MKNILTVLSMVLLMGLSTSVYAKDTAKEFNVTVSATGEIFVDGAPSDIEGLKQSAKAKAAASPDATATVSANKAVSKEKITAVIDAIKLSGLKKANFVSTK